MEITDEIEMDLKTIATSFFRKKKFDVKEEVTLMDESGKKHHFEMVVSIENDVQFNKIAVKILDWKRTVGVDRLIRFERILSDFRNLKGMIVSNRFSESAINFARRRGLVVYSREDLLLLIEE